MKNKTYVPILILVLFTMLLTSCSEDKTEQTTNSKNTDTSNTMARAAGESDLSSKITVNTTTSIISEMFFNMGVSRILVATTPSETKYNLVASKTFTLDGEAIHFSTKEFLLSDNFISEAQHPEYAMASYNNEIYLRYQGKEDLLSKFENLEKDVNVHILLLFLNEITMNSNKLEFDAHMTNFSSRGGGCSFANTIYVFGIGLTTSAAASNLIHSVEGSSINSFSCRKLNAAPELTNWGGFYTSTNTYCCRPGSGGSW